MAGPTKICNILKNNRNIKTFLKLLFCHSKLTREHIIIHNSIFYTTILESNLKKSLIITID